MGLKLFKNKDPFGVYDFLKEANSLQKFVNKKQSKNNYVTLDDVAYIISKVKELYNNAKKIEISIKNSMSTQIKHKDKEFMLLIIIDKIKELKLLYDNVIIYEKQLNKYKKISKNEK